MLLTELEEQVLVAFVIDPDHASVPIRRDFAGRVATFICVLLLRVEAADVLEDACRRRLVTFV